MIDLSLRKSVDLYLDRENETSASSYYWINNGRAPSHFYDDLQADAYQIDIMIPQNDEGDCFLILNHRISIAFDHINDLRKLGQFILDNVGRPPKV